MWSGSICAYSVLQFSVLGKACFRVLLGREMGPGQAVGMGCAADSPGAAEALVPVLTTEGVCPLPH